MRIEEIGIEGIGKATDFEKPKIEDSKFNPVLFRNKMQAWLAIKIFEKPAEEAMLEWVEGGENSYSKLFSDLENDLGFKNHSDLQGDISRITPEIFTYYLKNRSFPENL